MIRLKAVTPSEFWQLTPSEGMLFIDDVHEQTQKLSEPEKPKSKLNAKQLEHLETRRAKLRAKGHNVI